MSPQCRLPFDRQLYLSAITGLEWLLTISVSDTLVIGEAAPPLPNFDCDHMTVCVLGAST